MADAAQTAAAKLKVFISYSRHDQIFVDNLAPALSACGFETFYDREDIAPGEDWQKRLDRLILAADTVVYVISPSSVKSERVGWEVTQTEHRGKRILPILLEQVEEAGVPAGLTRLNWIPFNKPELFGNGLAQLVAALNTDLDWVRDHTRLGEIATRWAERNKPEALLIRGEELLDAERWLVKRPPGGLQATDAHRLFISASRTAEDARQSRERAQLEAISVAQSEREKAIADAEVVQQSRARLQRRLTYGLVAVAAAVVLGGALTIFQSRDVARSRATLMRYLAQQSITDAAYDRSMRLSLQGLSQFSQPLLGFKPDDVGVKTLEATLVNGTMQSRLRFALPSAEDPIIKGAFSPDGKIALAASLKGAVQVLQADTGKVIAGFKNEAGGISKLDFSDDGQLAVVRSIDGTLSIWQLPQGTEALIIPPSKELRAIDAAISPDNKLTAVALSDDTVRIWNIAARREVAKLVGHTGDVVGVRFDPAGKSILTFSVDGTAGIWDARSYQRIARLAHEGGSQPLAIENARYIKNGESIVTVTATSAKAWDATTGAMVAQRTVDQSEWPDFELGPDGQVMNHVGSRALIINVLGDARDELRQAEPVTRAAFSKDGSRALVTTDKMAFVWDVRGHTILGRSALGPNDRAVMGPDGLSLFIGSQAGEARVLQIAVGRSFLGVLGARRSVAFRPGTDEVAVAGYGGVISVLDAKTGAPLRAIAAHQQARSLTIAIDPNGRKLATATDAGAVSIWDMSTWAPVALEGHRKAVKWVAFDPSGARLVTCSEDETARVWDATSGKLLWTLKHGKYVSSASFSPDSKRIVTGSWDNTASIWDASTGARLQELKGHTGQIEMVEFSPDGTRVVTASLDATARIWDVASGRMMGVPLEHLGPVFSASFSRDGKRLVTASQDKTARVWNAETGKLIVSLKGHTDPIYAASFSPNGEWVLTASQDKTAQLWDVRSGAQLAIVAEHEAPVQSATFSPDGTRVVTTSEDGSGRIWQTDWPLLLQGEVLRDKVCAEKLVGAQVITRTDADIYPALFRYLGDNVCKETSLISSWRDFGKRLLWPVSLFGASREEARR